MHAKNKKKLRAVVVVVVVQNGLVILSASTLYSNVYKLEIKLNEKMASWSTNLGF